MKKAIIGLAAIASLAAGCVHNMPVPRDEKLEAIYQMDYKDCKDALRLAHGLSKSIQDWHGQMSFEKLSWCGYRKDNELIVLDTKDGTSTILDAINDDIRFLDKYIKWALGKADSEENKK